MIDLVNLDLEVAGNPTDGYRVQVRGPEEERDSAPFEAASIAGLAADLEAIRAGNTDRARLERVGSALFRALLPMPIMMVYVQVKARLDAEQGVRLRLHLPPELARLPWELIHYPPDYLCLAPTSPVVRFVDLPDRPRPLVVRAPLRLLHLVASPVDVRPLDVEREKQLLRSALAAPMGDEKVEIVAVPRGTQATLRDGLRQRCHCLHFSGHGGVAQDGGFLLFEDSGGHSQAVTGDMLAQALQGSNIRLAVLNACESAAAGTGDGFGSVAETLVRAGLPAVVAHQFPIADSGAASFATEFYAALSDGYPVDAAVSEGRKAILATLGPAWREQVDWATPVLFMRAPDGKILDLAKDGDEEQPGRRPAMAVTMGDVGGSAITMGDFHDGQINIGAGPFPAEVPDRAPVRSLPALLREFRERVRDQAPAEKRRQALKQVALLRGAATEKRPDLALIEEVWLWFQDELPALSGSVLGVLFGLKLSLEELGDDWLLADFQDRFGEFS